MRQLRKLLYQIPLTVKYVTYIIIFVSLYLLLNLFQLHSNVSNIKGRFPNFPYSILKSQTPTKNVLLWTKFYLIFNGTSSIFPDLQCKVNNCIFTVEKDHLDGDYSRFDAIIFDEGELTRIVKPQKRDSSQIYVFTTIESAYNVPACELYNDNFFNWTFTYRLDSDVTWPYFFVRNETGHVIAPSNDIVWRTSKNPISTKLKTILRQKTKAAAWLVSHCQADSFRDEYLSKLQENLFHFSLKIDVYGSCSAKKCTGDCEEMLYKDYYFYMAFENSFSEDYVTEKVLHGYDNYVVPIVYGGANYSRFLPPDSYINAREMHPYNLAYIINRAIKDPTFYESFFKWTNLYTIEKNNLPGKHPLCSFCEALNSVETTHVYKEFRRWWNGQNGMKWCLPQEYWNETSRLNLDARHIYKLY